jgi:ABC-2 type transport system ATP-binding protein
MPSDGLVLDLHDIHKTYGRGRRRVQALRGVSLQVGPGEIFGLLGPNGAGKSTLVKILMTVVRPDRADGTILGQPVGSKPILARVGYLPEHHRFPRYLTGRQMLEFFGALAGVPRKICRPRAQELLELVGMKDWGDRRVDTYSKGMMQRVGVAQSLINNPQLVVLDEPTDGVDPIGRQEIREVLVHLRSQGRSVFVNSHMLSELELICDRVAIMTKGKVIRQGTIRELSSHRQWYELEVLRGPLPATPPLRAIVAAMDNHGIWIEGDLRDTTELVKVGTADPQQVQAMIDALRQRGFVITRVQAVRPTLEDLFMEAVTEPPAPLPIPGEARP